ncbi:YcxB family protein [Streptomyces sp. LHD-70]|uniref:YcxB family protein n=1 Tax=Streptomyces sp. LHD-70 TaxID=3072140 RepID=UPI00280CDFEE|nr:YcxB family protein [Streptomyces sp. LHD-70]MDQ8703363.1 YcxB family protein [Streptomyces sp. LHD-70]
MGGNVAGGRSGDGTADSDRPEGVAVADGGPAAVQLTYRPRQADTLVGLKVRERIKKAALVGRSLFLVVWVGHGVLTTLRSGADLVSIFVFALFTLILWGYPRIQAAYVQRLVGWQGEYRTTVSAQGLSCSTDYSTLTQKWSMLRGYRETADHFVLLSRDPNIMCLDVLPKRGVRSPEDVDRLRALLDRHSQRV